MAIPPDPAGPDVTTPSGSAVLLTASRRLLRPFVALLIRRGITFPLIVDLLRGLYVEVAANDLLPDPRSRTDSRISLMTGVHRKEIRRQRASQIDEFSEPAIVTTATQVIARWLAMATDGATPPLPRSADGSSASFDRIVAEVTTDIRPRSLLEDWLGQGLVRLDEADRVHLNVDAFLPRPGSDEQAYFLGRNLADHIAVGAANLLATASAPFLDRSAHYDRLSPDTARRIETAARDIVARALGDINAMALAEIDREPAAQASEAVASAGGRVNVGIFVYREDLAPEPAARANQQA